MVGSQDCFCCRLKLIPVDAAMKRSGGCVSTSCLGASAKTNDRASEPAESKATEPGGNKASEPATKVAKTSVVNDAINVRLRTLSGNLLGTVSVQGSALGAELVFKACAFNNESRTLATLFYMSATFKDDTPVREQCLHDADVQLIISRGDELVSHGNPEDAPALN